MPALPPSGHPDNEDESATNEQSTPYAYRVKGEDEDAETYLGDRFDQSIVNFDALERGRAYYVPNRSNGAHALRAPGSFGARFREATVGVSGETALHALYAQVIGLAGIAYIGGTFDFPEWLTLSLCGMVTGFFLLVLYTLRAKGSQDHEPDDHDDRGAA